jgi:hypothetical protein
MWRMRTAKNREQFTPFSLWLQEYCRSDLSITNLDFVIEDYKNRKIMLLEEKQYGGRLHHAQCLTFDVVDYACTMAAKSKDYDYWGFFLLQLPENASMIGPGIMLNGRVITAEQLQAHINFAAKAAPRYRFPWMEKKGAA